MSQKTKYQVINLFGEVEDVFIENKTQSESLFHDYDGFADKFKISKTTDDCYTPADVFDEVISYVKSNFDIEGKRIVRPFFPEMDYKQVDYNQNDVVIDNPPFSIISDICKWYNQKGIKFFMFAPHLTLFSANLEDVTYVVCSAPIEYENKAKVNTSFITNLDCEFKIMTASKLRQSVIEVQNENKHKLPSYTYPKNVVTVSLLQRVMNRGFDVNIKEYETHFIRSLDSQSLSKKTIFGSGFLVSDDKSREIEYKVNSPIFRHENESIEWEISERERKIIKELDK